MNIIKFSDSRNKMERVWSGKALRGDLAGDTPEEKTKAEIWYMREYVFNKRR
jgi:hypothetical protein